MTANKTPDTYCVKTLVYYEMFEDAGAAIHWETRLKKYKREWKLNLIEKRKSRLARPDRWSLKICA